MKNSAWYHKLWLKKLSELPLKEDSASAWTGMKGMLDAQLPVSSSAGHGSGTGTAAAKPFVAKLIALVGYVLPAAAAIGVATCLVLPLVIKPKPVALKKRQQSHLSGDLINHKTLPLFSDSAGDTAAGKYNILRDTALNTPLYNADPIAGLVVRDFSPGKTPVVEDAIHKDRDTQLPRKPVKQNAVIARSYQHADRSADPGGVQVLNEALVPDQSRVSALKSEIGDAFRTDQSDDLPGKQKISAGASLSFNIELAKQKDALLKDKIIDRLVISGADEALVHRRVSGNRRTEAKMALAKNSKAGRNQKAKKVKPEKIKEIITPLYDAGLESGWNTGKKNSFYFGVFGSYRITSRLLLNTGVRLNTSVALSGNYLTKSANIPGDSLSYAYKVSDSRTLMVFNIPLTAEYRLSDRISINAGPVISFPLSQSDIKSQSELIRGSLQSTKYLDSVRHRSVDSTLTHAALNKISLGITGGVSIRFNQFYIEAKYLRNFTPYKVDNPLGSYQQYYRSFQLGIRYKFKK